MRKWRQRESKLLARKELWLAEWQPPLADRELAFLRSKQFLIHQKQSIVISPERAASGRRALGGSHTQPSARGRAPQNLGMARTRIAQHAKAG